MFELELTLYENCEMTSMFNTFRNFQDYAKAQGDTSFWSEVMLKKEYDATIDTGRNVGAVYLTFPTEEQCNWFLLRWT